MNGIENKKTLVKFETPFVFHCRNTKKKPFERGGLTIVFDPTVRRFGLAFCSKKDNYNRKLGKTIALGRAKHCIGPDFLSDELNEKEMYVELICDLANKIACHYGFKSGFEKKTYKEIEKIS